ncbi:hypothetical protein [Acinetobacter terrae]|uniref:hypothetical protein n=1 Tax=Acinetobacter terrae TaxID=2731247 RepID=UPI00148A75A6|nr:hypothetical protein [Acinetobacter terrae]
MSDIVYEFSGSSNWFVVHERLCGYAVFMDNQFQAEFLNQEDAEKFISDVENCQ